MKPFRAPLIPVLVVLGLACLALSVYIAVVPPSEPAPRHAPRDEP